MMQGNDSIVSSRPDYEDAEGTIIQYLCGFASLLNAIFDVKCTTYVMGSL